MEESAELRAQRRAASEQLVESLAISEDPVLAYKARLLVGVDPDSAEATMMRDRIPGSPMARALLRVLEQDAKTLQHTYRNERGDVVLRTRPEAHIHAPSCRLMSSSRSGS